MLKPKSPQTSFYGSYLYDRIVPQDHPVSSTGQALLRKINQMNTFSAVCYGASLKSTGDLGTDKLFTGQRLDGTGLYYYGARYYDPQIGRFISADTVVPNPGTPQAMNRYSYVLTTLYGIKTLEEFKRGGSPSFFIFPFLYQRKGVRGMDFSEDSSGEAGKSSHHSACEKGQDLLNLASDAGR